MKVKILLHTWYQEVGDQIEIYKEFEDMQEACEYLGANIVKILDEYPVIKIEIN